MRFNYKSKSVITNVNKTNNARYSLLGHKMRSHIKTPKISSTRIYKPSLQILQPYQSLQNNFLYSKANQNKPKQNKPKQNKQTHIAINKEITVNILKNEVDKKISEIHNQLKLNYGIFKDELPEQKMVVRYLTGREKVLEIGGNIGRNSLVIASILHDNNNLVTLESDSSIANQLKENRDINNFTFHIENSALSKRKLIQRDWDTIVSDTLLPGYKNINTITLDQLNSKYNIDFDTLVLDCEGAFYYILMDMPEILNNINLIIMENDYRDISHKNYIDTILKNNKFKVDYVESGGWGPCKKKFFEVWKRI